jgi:hypothetical protein
MLGYKFLIAKREITTQGIRDNKIQIKLSTIFLLYLNISKAPKAITHIGAIMLKIEAI